MEYHFEHSVSFSAPLFLKSSSSLLRTYAAGGSSPLHTLQREFRSLHGGYDPHKHNMISQLNAITTQSVTQTPSINIYELGAERKSHGHESVLVLHLIQTHSSLHDIQYGNHILCGATKKSRDGNVYIYYNFVLFSSILSKPEVKLVKKRFIQYTNISSTP